MFVIAILAQIIAFFIKKYPLPQIDGDAVVAAEIENERKGGVAV